MLSLAGGVSAVEKFDTEDTDALDNWSHRRAEGMALANISAANQVHNQYGSLGYSSWSYNPWYGMYTFIPMSGTMCNPYYGYCYYSPLVGYNRFFSPNVVYGGGGYNAAASGFNPGYSTMGGTATGASSVMSSAHSMGSSPSMSSGSTASSAAASSSAGHGSAGGAASGGGGGGHGK